MKKIFLTLPLMLQAWFCNPALAQDGQDVYLCINEQGQKEYKNTGITKGCKKVELPTITTVNAPKARVAPKDGAAKTGKDGASASTPSDFPKVDSATQKKRDTDSRQIFQEELNAEEKKLADLKREFNGGNPERRGDEANFAKYQERVQKMRDDISRTEKNVEALKREIANLK
ncbi:DUF4124 domain-containing protein [Massilia sp. W12]|uniref:DUF4124 domain-containing protein n=1 Tax=Massilia sp. W12 TaxID=3126507 RepID=UPI0030D0D25E